MFIRVFRVFRVFRGRYARLIFSALASASSIVPDHVERLLRAP